MENNEKFSAYHEAGHCVAYLSMGYKFIGVTIDQEITSALVQPSGKQILGTLFPPKDWYGQNYQDAAVVDYAGPLAEAEYRKCSLDALESREEDLKHAQEMFGKWVQSRQGVTIEAIQGYTIKRTREYLKEHWNWVRAIAEALQNHRSLEYNDVAKIAASVSNIERIDTREDLDRELQKLIDELPSFKREVDALIERRGW